MPYLVAAVVLVGAVASLNLLLTERAAAARLPGGPAQALAVVSADSQDDVADRVAQLRPVARVVVEPPGGPVSQAFSVLGWPALCQLDADGTIVTTDSEQVVAAAAAAAA